MRGLHRQTALGQLAAAVAAALFTAACGPAAQPPPPPPPTPTAAPAAERASDLETGKVGEFHSKRFQITLPLPDGRAWKIDDHSGTWLVATHAASSSELAVRA